MLILCNTITLPLFNCVIFTSKFTLPIALFVFGNMFNFSLNLDICVIYFEIFSLRIIQ